MDNTLKNPFPRTQKAGCPDAGFFTVGSGDRTRRIAFLRRPAMVGGGAPPGLVWLGGFNSNMRGIKADALDRRAAEQGRACLRFDYSGHGESGGAFETSTIGMWLEESVAAVRALTDGPNVLVGSSMGGWLALLCARALHASGDQSRLMGLVLIAPAVDFTERLIWEPMPAKAKAELGRTGVWLRPSRYSAAPDRISKGLIEEARDHLLLGGAIRAHCPIHILQGMQDQDVPWRDALALVEHLAGDPVSLTLVKDGDHRLSRDEDIARIWAAVEAMG
jgi:pimeloyl-ACP methyl ester carboxylesterase